MKIIVTAVLCLVVYGVFVHFVAKFCGFNNDPDAEGTKPEVESKPQG